MREWFAPKHRRTWAIVLGIAAFTMFRYGQTHGFPIISQPTSTPVSPPTSTDTWYEINCNLDAVNAALTELKHADEDYADAVKLVLDSGKAAGYSANSSAVVTALSQFREVQRSTQRLTVPACMDQAQYALVGFMRNFDDSLRGCLYDHDCENFGTGFDDEPYHDYQDYAQYGLCQATNPPPYGDYEPCTPPMWARTYEPDGSLYISPQEHTAIAPLRNYYRTKQAMIDAGTPDYAITLPTPPP